MTNVYHLPPEKPRYRDATQWVSRIDRGLSADEELRLQEWLDLEPENRQLFLEVAMQWDRFGELSRLADLFPEPATRYHKSSRTIRYLAVAAVLVVAVSGLLAVNHNLSAVDDPQVVDVPLASIYETAVGEQSTVVLADGSRVTLNTNSRLDVQYSDVHRVLTLGRGEVHVDVAHEAGRPLTVFAGDKMVQAVGTAFGVEMRADQDIEVVVTEGKVLVSKRPKSPVVDSAVPQAPVLPPSTLTVTQGEEVRLGTGIQSTVRNVSEEEIRVRLAWRQGDLIFRGEPLGEAMTEVGRYTTVEFVFLNNRLKEERVVGRYKAGDVDGLLAGLSENLSITYEKTTDGRILLGSL